jgi:hypothetical protein
MVISSMAIGTALAAVSSTGMTGIATKAVETEIAGTITTIDIEN